MFGISFGEMVIIAAIGVLVLGPERCIDLFRKAGKLWRTLRAEMASAKDAFDDIDKPS